MGSVLSKGALFPEQLTNEMFNLVRGKSSLARLSGAKPLPFNGEQVFTFSMDSEVNIVDSGGNLVCKTRSHGGTAVWDGKDAYGKRATPGIYTALCNTTGGHTAVKIMFIP